MSFYLFIYFLSSNTIFIFLFYFISYQSMMINCQKNGLLSHQQLVKYYLLFKCPWHANSSRISLLFFFYSYITYLSIIISIVCILTMMTACFFLFFYWFMLCLLTLCKSRQKYINQYEEKKKYKGGKKK